MTAYFHSLTNANSRCIEAIDSQSLLPVKVLPFVRRHAESVAAQRIWLYVTCSWQHTMTCPVTCNRQYNRLTAYTCTRTRQQRCNNGAILAVVVFPVTNGSNGCVSTATNAEIRRFPACVGGLLVFGRGGHVTMAWSTDQSSAESNVCNSHTRRAHSFELKPFRDFWLFDIPSLGPNSIFYGICRCITNPCHNRQHRDGRSNGLAFNFSQLTWPIQQRNLLVVFSLFTSLCTVRGEPWCWRF